MGVNVPSRPVMRYHGGKWKLAPWIISHFPQHRVYIEPFGGAASVLLRKIPALTEVYNDIDGEVVNLFRVLRSDSAVKLIHQVTLTPFSRDEFDQAFDLIENDPVERARRLIVRSFFAGGSRGVLDVDRATAGFNGGSARSRGESPNASHARDWANYANTLPALVERLRSVVIENRPALDLLRQHDSPETLFYIDPPYLESVRSDRARRAYRHELSNSDHEALLAAVLDLQGFVVLSGYASPLYDAVLGTWRRVYLDTFADGATPRTEVLWLSCACAAALDRECAEPRLFGMDSA